MSQDDGMNAPRSPDRPFALAGRVIDPQIRQVRWSGREKSIEPKSLQLLLAFIAAEGRTLSRDALIDAVWNGAAVSEDAVHRAIWKLRRALDDDPRQPVIIGTLPKSGYRLLASPKWDVTSGEDHGPASSVRRSVVPFPAFAAATVFAVIAVWFATRPGGGEDQQFDFTRARAVTTAPGYEFAPALSPKGDRLAYVSFDYERPDPSLDIMMLDPATQTPEMLYGGAGLQAWPAWAPDGERLLSVNADDDGCKVVLFFIASRTGRKIAPCFSPDAVRFAWGADQHVYLIDGVSKDGPGRLFKLNIETGNRIEISTETKNLTDVAMSSDGRWLAIVDETSRDRYDIELIDLRDMSQKRLTKESRNIQGLAWQSDGRALIVSSDWAGLFRLWRLDVSSGAMTAIATPGMNASFPETRAPGGALYYQVWNSDINLQRFTGDANDKTRVVASNRWEWSPAPSPDGRSVAFLTNRDGGTALWVADPDGTAARKVAQFDAWFDSRISWSPDGETLALSVLAGDRFSIRILDMTGREISTIGAPGYSLRDPVFASDGQSLYYASDESGAWTIRKRNIDGKPGEEIITEGVFAQLSGDGAHLFAADEPGGIARIDLATGDERAVTGGRRAGLVRAWAPVGEDVVFLEGDIPEGYRLMIWRESSGEISQLAALDGEIHETSVIAQDPSGGIWLARIDASGSDLWEAPARR